MPVTVLDSGYSVVVKMDTVILRSALCAVILELLLWERLCGWNTDQGRDQCLMGPEKWAGH